MFSETEIVYEDEEFIVFNDYRPAAEFHILIIPKKHYGPLQTLSEENIPMIEQMKEIGMKLLAEKTNFDVSTELLEGFHWPIVSVNHFHLHFIAPKQQMNCFKKIEFHPWTFGNVQMAIEKLQNMQTKIE